MNPVLAFADFLVDPRMGEYAHAFRTHAPTWMVDQLDAAATAADRATTAIGQVYGADQPHLVAPTQVPDWLIVSMSATFVALFEARADTCRHNPHVEAPQPILAAAWYPNLITCIDCAHLFKLPRGSVAEKTCDACGHLCTGPDNDDGIHTSLIRNGLLIFQYGACRTCKTDIENYAR